MSKEGQFYVGKCPHCGTINAATIAVDIADCAMNVAEMVESGLNVEKIMAETVSIKLCEHCYKHPAPNSPLCVTTDNRQKAHVTQ